MPLPDVPPHTRIALLRHQRGESLETFGLAIGVRSKGRVSEIERGLRAPTAEQALAIERISAGAVDAAVLNDTVAACRAAGAPAPAEAAGELERVVLCDPCGLRLDEADVRRCLAVDCPHAGREAA